MSGIEQPLEVEAETEADDSAGELRRPRTVGECRGGIRPCPFVSCRFNLLIDVSDNGAIQFNLPKVAIMAAVAEVSDTNPTRANRADPQEKFEAQADAAVDHWFASEQHVSSCLIDEVKDSRTLEEISNMLCTTRERVRQIEVIAIERLTKRVATDLGVHGMEDVAGEE